MNYWASWAWDFPHLAVGCSEFVLAFCLAWRLTHPRRPQPDRRFDVQPGQVHQMPGVGTMIADAGGWYRWASLPAAVLSTDRPLTNAAMRKMEGLHQAVQAGMLAPSEVRPMMPPDVSWIEFEGARR